MQCAQDPHRYRLCPQVLGNQRIAAVVGRFCPLGWRALNHPVHGIVTSYIGCKSLRTHSLLELACFPALLLVWELAQQQQGHRRCGSAGDYDVVHEPSSGFLWQSMPIDDEHTACFTLHAVGSTAADVVCRSGRSPAPVPGSGSAWVPPITVHIPQVMGKSHPLFIEDTFSKTGRKKAYQHREGALHPIPWRATSPV